MLEFVKNFILGKKCEQDDMSKMMDYYAKRLMRETEKNRELINKLTKENIYMSYKLIEYGIYFNREIAHKDKNDQGE